MEVHVILGGPGCNKTGLLTELYAKCVNQYGWDKVAFISYTVAQVRRDKSKVKSITKLSADKLDAFRTIHSAARQHYTEETVVIPEREFEGMSVFMDIDMTKEEFLEEFSRLHIGEWRKHYNTRRYGYTVCDGTQWSLEINYSNGIKPVKIYGDNAYPYNFDSLKDLMGCEDLEGEDENE